MRKLVIVPCYNEAGTIQALIAELRDKAPSWDIVVINDASTDNSLDICIQNSFPVLNLCANLGIGGAMQTGYQYASQEGYDIVAQLDGDGQHDPAYLDRLALPILSDEADMVIGSRFIAKEGFQSSGIRRVGISYFKWLIKLLSGRNITDATSGFRLVNSDICRFFAQNYSKDYPEPDSIMKVLRMGKRVMEIPVIMRSRQAGVSSIRPLHSIYYMLKVTVAILFGAITTSGKVNIS